MAYEEDRQSALTRALIMAGAAMTQPGPGGFMASLGRGGMMGLNAYDNTFEEMNRRRLQEEALKRSALEDKLKEIALARQQALAGIFNQFGSAQGQSSAPAGPRPSMMDAPDWKANPANPLAPNAAQSARAQAQPEGADPAEELIKRLAAGGFPAEAKAQLEVFKGLEGEVYGEPQVDNDGRVYVNTKRGPKYIKGGFVPRDKLVTVDLGGRTGLRGEYDTNLRAIFDKSVSADTLFTAANPAPVRVEGVNGSYWETPPGRGPGVGGGARPAGAPAQGPAQGPAPQGAATQGTPVGRPEGFISKSQAEREDAIRQEFRKTPAVQNYETVIPILNAAEKAGDTRIGDVNLVYAAAKMFDPTSVVRESEYGTVVSANNIPNWLQGHVNALMGGGKLSAGARKELMAELNARVAAHEDMYKQVRGTYEGIARSQGLDPSRIFTDFPRVGSSRRKQGAIGKAQGSGARTVNFNDLPD